MEFISFLSLMTIFLAATARSAPVASLYMPDGFWLKDLESGKTFTFGIIPQTLGEATTVSFYEVDFPYTDCSQVQVEILDDGYVKRDFNKIAVICDAPSLSKFTATSGRGFHVIVRMGDKVDGGSIKARFVAASGTSVTSLRLYGDKKQN